MPVGTLASGDLDQSFTGIHSARSTHCGDDFARSLSLAAELVADYGGGGRRRLTGEHRSGYCGGHDLCAMALAAADTLPLQILLQTVPIVAIAPLIINWAGAGIFPVTILTFIICLAPIIANTTQGLISVDENLIHLFLMYKASPAQILFKLRLPNSLPNLFTGIRISAGISVIGGITGELFAGSTRVGEGGLGYAIIYASNQMETGYLFALVFAAAVLGFVFFFIVMFLEWLALRNWHESSRAQTFE